MTAVATTSESRPESVRPEEIAFAFAAQASSVLFTGIVQLIETILKFDWKRDKVKDFKFLDK